MDCGIFFCSLMHSGTECLFSHCVVTVYDLTHIVSFLISIACERASGVLERASYTIDVEIFCFLIVIVMA